jgi:hypothetical protein
MAGAKGLSMGGRVLLGAALAGTLALVCAASAAAGHHRPSSARGVCHPPHLTGLTLEVAQRRAARSGCSLRLEGAKLRRADIQTIGRQSPRAGRRSWKVTVWLNPFCRGSSAFGPGIAEPAVTPGPTELLSGFYLAGGPLATFSYPHCMRPPPPPGPGMVEVLGADGTVVATRSSTAGHLVEIPLPAGSYTIKGTFLDATVNGAHPTETESVVLPAGHTVRQDFVLNIP